MTSKHTPGPWEACIEEQCIRSAEGDMIAQTHMNQITIGDAGDSNCMLMAASPTMLEALNEAEAGLECAIAIIKKLGEGWDRSSPQLALEIVKSAIQRATGGAEG